MHIRIIPVGTPRSAGLSEEEMIPILQDGGAAHVELDGELGLEERSLTVTRT